MLYEQKTEQLRLFGDSMVEEPDGLLPDKLPDDYTPEEVKGHFEVWKKSQKAAQNSVPDHTGYGL